MNNKDLLYSTGNYTQKFLITDKGKESQIYIYIYVCVCVCVCVCILQVALVTKEPPCQCRQTEEMRVRSLGQKDLLEEGTATHSSILAWRIPWTEETDELQSIGPHRVGHN